ncbi:SIMPL domain-containing protein [Halobacillus sp. Marseille-Q1614]|uniref:SIMPL domain-containing protein n=1 Tax=Halobacillus sp. Marseille-Q1614 TaxID=2709134 RepID=UPI00156E2E66|nr:SIMPL domain-containing protein [Halobacillus sp. Marseille-Q1614]
MYPQSIQRRLITVSGAGKMSAQPDVATVQLGVVTKGKDLTRTQQENARVMTQVIQAVEGTGVPRSNIRTVDYSIQPQYDYIEGQQVFRGYEVRNIVSVTIENINQTGTVIDTAVQNGANQVTNIEFSVQNPEALYQEALSKALKEAYRKAQTIAQTMRMQLDPSPIKVVERKQEGVVPLAQTAVFSAPTPIEPGQLEVEAFVEVQFQVYV